MGQGLERAKVDVAGGSLAFGSVTGAYQNLLTAANATTVRKLFIFNTLNTDSVISLNGGTTDWVILPAGLSCTIDFDMSLQFDGAVAMKHNGAGPASGRISAAILRGR